jgi:hypothetical protein
VLMLHCLSSACVGAATNLCLAPCICRLCSINMQRRSAQEAAGLLDQHAAAADELARQFREAAAPACSGSRSVPQSPRGSLATPRSMPADPTLLSSPRRQQQQSQQWRSPAASPTPRSPRARQRLCAERQAPSPAPDSSDEEGDAALNDSDSETNSIIQQLRHQGGVH